MVLVYAVNWRRYNSCLIQRIGQCQYWQTVCSTQVASGFGLILMSQVYHKLHCDGLMLRKSNHEIFEVQVVAT